MLLLLLLHPDLTGAQWCPHQVKVWDLRGKDMVSQFKGHKAGVTHVKVGPLGSHSSHPSDPSDP